MDLKQTTPFNRPFLLVLSSDHLTGFTGASCASIVVQGSKNGGAMTTLTAIVSEIGAGFYNAALKTSDVSTLGAIAFDAAIATADHSSWVDVVRANILGDQFGVNVQAVNGLNASSVTQLNPYIGSLQPINFSGTSTSASMLAALNSSQTVQAGSVLDKSGYSLTQAFPANFSAQSISAAGNVSLNSSQTVQAGSVLDKTGYALTSAYDPAKTASQAGDAMSISTAGLTRFFSQSSGTTYAAATAGSVVAEIANNAGGASITVPQIVSGVWNASSSTYNTAGTVGGELANAASAGDPWATPIPGAYGAGTAGNIVGNNIDRTISSRMSSAQTVVVGTNNDKTGYTASTVSDKTGYSLSQSFPANFANFSITSGGLVSINSSSSVVVSAPVTVGTNNDKTGYALAVAPPTSAAITTAVLTTQMGEAYAALHTVPTMAQILFEMRALLGEKVVSGSSVSVLQIDGATLAETFYLDSTSPTFIHRAN